jgi:hypothetical protein
MSKAEIHFWQRHIPHQSAHICSYNAKLLGFGSIHASASIHSYDLGEKMASDSNPKEEFKV